jgi:hypothetical protein
MRPIVAVLVLAAVLVSCSACGVHPNGPGAASASSANAPADPIPPVRDPKNLAGTSPCTLLTPAQLTANQIDKPGRIQDVLRAPGCKWDNNSHTREIAMWITIGPDVLHNLYAQRDTYPVFEITQVAGHPAIRTKNLVNGTTCNFVVAAAEKQALDVRFTSLREGLEEPCAPARALTEAAIGNLPPQTS